MSSMKMGPHVRSLLLYSQHSVPGLALSWGSIKGPREIPEEHAHRDNRHLHTRIHIRVHTHTESHALGGASMGLSLPGSPPGGFHLWGWVPGKSQVSDREDCGEGRGSTSVSEQGSELRA